MKHFIQISNVPRLFPRMLVHTAKSYLIRLIIGDVLKREQHQKTFLDLQRKRKQQPALLQSSFQGSLACHLLAAAERGNRGSRVTPAFAVEVGSTSLGNFAAAQVAGGGAGGGSIQRVCIVFPNSICSLVPGLCPRPPRAASRGTRGHFAHNKRTLVRPPPPHAAPARASRGSPGARPGRSRLPAPRFQVPGRGGGEAATIGRVRPKRAPRSAKTRGAASPGRAAARLAGAALPAAADWRMLEFGLKAPEEVF